MRTKRNYLLSFLLTITVIIALLFVWGCEKEEPVRQATLSTLSVNNITTNTAQSGGNITSDGGGAITSRGVVWSISSNPTVEQNSGITIDGSGEGVFQSNIAGLLPITTYYLRAYANNEAGIVYGNEQQFTTMGTAPIVTEIQVVEVTNPVTGKTWMDRNLGAFRVATSSTDAQAYGHLYQWGRAADWHQLRTSGTTSTLSNSDTPGHGDFITAGSGSNYDWRSPKNDNLWKGINGTNNPCPSGYRLPTEAELDAERQSWDTYDAAGAFGSPLKFPVAGRRSLSDGSIYDVGSLGYYWTGTVAGTRSQYLYLSSSGAGMSSSYRAHGLSVRCLKDD